MKFSRAKRRYFVEFRQDQWASVDPPPAELGRSCDAAYEILRSDVAAE